VLGVSAKRQAYAVLVFAGAVTLAWIVAIVTSAVRG
jgi:hypothetical protein